MFSLLLSSLVAAPDLLLLALSGRLVLLLLGGWLLLLSFLLQALLFFLSPILGFAVTCFLRLSPKCCRILQVVHGALAGAG